MDSTNHELTVKEARELENLNRFNECIAKSDAYLRQCNEAVQEIRLCVNWAEKELNELRSKHAAECNMRDEALLELYHWAERSQTARDVEKGLQSKVDEIVKKIAANDDHRAEMEKENCLCKRQLSRWRKHAKQRELQLELLENNEWRRFGKMIAKTTQVVVERVDAATITDPARDRGTREPLAVRKQQSGPSMHPTLSCKRSRLLEVC